ncbi:hypothetical protein FHS42_006690 [Streptomyces zagrosensis]|uniref:Uncharacterized protein n=1 Tax=Streptomyces zagrosensis TaxID=1042984 RepID=A0A7W9QGH9_9ACTN|nr:hypothetical protein [Streptomyces zagrosensis]
MATHEPTEPAQRIESRAPSVTAMLASCAAATAVSTPPGGLPTPGVEPGAETEPAAQCAREAA